MCYIIFWKLEKTLNIAAIEVVIFKVDIIQSHIDINLAWFR